MNIADYDFYKNLKYTTFQTHIFIDWFTDDITKNRPRPAAYWQPACCGCPTQRLFLCYKCAVINICFIQQYPSCTLCVKTSIKVALPVTVSEILTFFFFRLNPRWLPKFELRVKNFVEISISLHFRNHLVFAFYAEIQDGRQKWWENVFL